MNNFIKVLHVYRTYFPDPPGGLQEAIRQICLNTKNFGVESRVFTLSPQPVPKEIIFEEATVIRGKSVIAPASCDISGISALSQFREQVEWCDIVHFHYPWPFGDLLSMLVPSSKPKIMTYHSDIVRQKFLSFLYRPLMKFTLKRMDMVVVTSPNYAKTSSTIRHFVRSDKIRVVPLGISDKNTSQFAKISSNILERLSLKPDDFVLSIGVIRYYKGLHSLIEATKQLPDVTFVIGGSGPEKNKLKNLANTLNVNNVIFTGQLTELEKHELLRNCKLFTLVSHLRSEAFGMVLVEASIYSKPMITCEIGTGTTFVNLNNETGLTIPPEDPEKLAKAIRDIYFDEGKRLEFGKKARLRYEELFSDKVLGKNYYRLYTDLLSNNIHK